MNRPAPQKPELSKYNQRSMSFYKSHAPKHREHTREVKLPELEGMKALLEEGKIPSRQWEAEVRRGKVGRHGHIIHDLGRMAHKCRRSLVGCEMETK